LDKWDNKGIEIKLKYRQMYQAKTFNGHLAYLTGKTEIKIVSLFMVDDLMVTKGKDEILPTAFYWRSLQSISATINIGVVQEE